MAAQTLAIIKGLFEKTFLNIDDSNAAKNEKHEEDSKIV
jgi:hypothetical protein